MISPEQRRLERALNLGKSPEGLSELLAMLSDESWLVRRGVIRALAFRGADAAPALVNVLITDRSSEAKIAAAVDTLVMMTASVDAVVETMAAHSDPAIAADAAQILGRRRNHSAVPTLIRLTKHQDDNVAVGAIEALGRIGGRAAVEALIESIRSENFFRIFPAIDVLGRSGDPRAVEPLVKLLDNPNYTHEAVRALGKTGERSAIKALLHIKTNSDSIFRVAASALLELREKFAEKSGGETLPVDEVIRQQAPKEMVPRLIRVLSNSDLTESIAICEILGAIGSPEATQALTQGLDANPSVALAAARALKKVGRDADETLLVALKEGSSERRKILLPIIARFSAANEVANCLTDSDSEIRALACEALMRLGNGDLVEKLFPLLADSSPRVNHAALACIQALGTRKARDLALESARSANANERKSALRILAYFGDDIAIEPLLNGLKDPELKVQEAAIQGLPYLEGPKALFALLEMAKHPQSKIRALTARSLGLVPNVSEQVVSVLLKLLSDSDSWVRYFACQSLGRLEIELSTPEIIKLLSDEAGQVRVSAVEALSHLNSPEAHLALRTAAQSEEVEMKRAALVGLGFSRRLEDLPVVLRGATSSDISTKLMALSSLAGFSSPLASDALCTAASDADEQVSSTAINFLAARPEKNATQILIELLKVETTRERARTALRISSKGRLSSILEFLESANDDLAPLLISVVSKMDRDEARMGLLSAIKSVNPAARRAAAAGLAARREPEMIQALQEAADLDADPEVRQICNLLLHD